MDYYCIIVLGNEMDKHGNLNIETISRLKLACSIYFKKGVKFLITTGWDYREDTALCLGSVMKEYAIKLGVPKQKIFSEINSRDTVGDAFFTKQNILIKRGWKNFLVITSDYHVNRTKKIFEFIYGKDYNLRIIGSKSYYNAKNQASELKSIEKFEKTFKNIQEGNDKMIYNTLSTLHPFYNGKVHPKI
jgi:uncharacterized SAM-binding protein YcdF (DUF218 family)